MGVGFVVGGYRPSQQRTNAGTGTVDLYFCNFSGPALNNTAEQAEFPSRNDRSQIFISDSKRGKRSLRNILRRGLFCFRLFKIVSYR
jgi:hypothetical protein